MLLNLTPRFRIIAWRLSEGRVISKSEIISAMFSDDLDGGPLDTQGYVGKLIFDLREALAGTGVLIEVNWGRGWFVPSDRIELLRSLLADEIARNVNFTSVSLSKAA